MKIDGPHYDVFGALDIPRNEDMPAGSPMVFACVGCGTPIWAPELYVARPKLCERCGGEWSEGPWGIEVPT